MVEQNRGEGTQRLRSGSRGGCLKNGGTGTLLQTMYLPMEHLSNDHEDCANQHENSHNLMQ